MAVISLNSNIAASAAQRRLNASTAAQERSFERLSTGLRINRAADDSAGIAVFTQLDTRGRVLGRAHQNISDGISLLSITDGALGQVSDVLTRLAELSGQAANGTFSAQQRQALQREYTALTSEIRRVGATTSFNRLNLLQRNGYSSSALTQTNEAGTALDEGQGGTTHDTNSVATSYDGRFVVGVQGSEDYNDIFITDRNDPAHSYDVIVSSARLTPIGVQSNGDFIYLQDNGLYRLSFATGISEQLTDQGASGATISSAVLSGDGSTIAFQTTATYADGATKSSAVVDSGVQHIVTLDLASGKFKNFATNVGTGVSLSISGDGRYISYLSTSNPVGQNGSARTQVFRIDTQIQGGGVQQLTAFTSNYTSLALVGVDPFGQTYINSRDNLTGTNSGLHYNLFAIDGTARTVRQLTKDTGTFGALDPGVQAAKLSNDGSTIFFIGKPSVGRIAAFQLSLDLGTLTQTSTSYSRSQSGGVTYDGALVSGDGSRIFFTSSYSPAQDATLTSYVELTTAPQSRTFDFEVGESTRGGISASLDSLLTSVIGLDRYLISTQSGAQSALDFATSALQAIATARGNVGAALARLAAASNLTLAQRVEVSAASGRIRDADIAEESAATVRYGITRNVAALILGQANQQPALALRLLSN